MHLSEILMDWHIGRNPYEIHRQLWRLFPGHADKARFFLYRVSNDKRGEPLRILMQSALEPKMTHSIRGCVVVRKKRFTPVFNERSRLRFLLCANPTKRLSKERCRVPIIDEEQLLQWLERKLNAAAILESAEIMGKRILHFWKDGKAGKIVTINFNGVLQVKDGEAMYDLLAKGIGPAKAFGCGLLSLAKA